MPKKPRIGRPPLPKGKSRAGRLYCRVLDAEVAEIESAARKAKKTKSEWVRGILLAAARARKAVP
jgi:hypothetical protein